MKIKLLLLCLFFAASIINAKVNTASSELKSVTLFLRGAELTHTSTVELKSGMQEIAFRGVADNIALNSIRITSNKGITIYSVSTRKNYLNKSRKSEKILDLKSKIKKLEYEKAKLSNSRDVNILEIEMIAANKTLANGKSLNVKQIKELGQYYQSKLNELKTKNLNINISIKEKNKKISALKKQLEELNAQTEKAITEIIAEVNVTTSGKYDFTISYLTAQASWQPDYFIRSESVGTPLEIEYNAGITQNTGVDWKNVFVVISTTNPNRNNQKPELPIWFIDFRREMAFAKSMVAPQAAMEKSQKAESASLSDYIRPVESELSVEFTPSVKYSVPSDNKPHNVALQKISVNADYSYFAVPKYNKHAFLVAKLKDFKSSSFLPGNANVFFEGNYAGKTYLNPGKFTNGWEISLGTDTRITVSKKKIEDFSEDEFFGSDVERKFGYEITATSRRSLPVNLIIEDNIPVSRNEDIKVEVIDISSAELDNKLGKLKWKIKLQPNRSVIKTLKYKVIYPKDKRIENL